MDIPEESPRARHLTCSKQFRPGHVSVSTPGEIGKILDDWCIVNRKLWDLEPTGRAGYQFWGAESIDFEIISLLARIRIEVTKLVKPSAKCIYWQVRAHAPFLVIKTLLSYTVSNDSQAEAPCASSEHSTSSFCTTAHVIAYCGHINS